MLQEAWDRHAEQWIAWARAPGHDSYWRFHRDIFLSLLPPLGLLTVDVGCGEGRVSRDLARLGHRVVALDGSAKMAGAAATHPDCGGPVLVADAADLPLANGVADCVVAFMSLQDVDAMETAVDEAAHVPSAEGAGSDRPFVIEGSWFERRRLADTCERGGYVMTFHSEHRPLQAYTDALGAAGFLIERLREVTEPDPSDKWCRIPLFLHLRAVRP